MVANATINIILPTKRPRALRCMNTYWHKCTLTIVVSLVLSVAKRDDYTITHYGERWTDSSDPLRHCWAILSVPVGLIVEARPATTCGSFCRALL